MRVRISTAVGAILLALAMTFGLTGTAMAAPTVRVNISSTKISASGGESSGSSRSVCVTLWQGVPIPFRGYNWSPVKRNCADRLSNSSIVSLGTGSIRCAPAQYYARTTTHSQRGGKGSQVAQKTSPVYSTACG